MITQIISILGAFAGIALGFILTVLWDSRKEKRAIRQRATYLAIRIVCILDKYIDGCISVAQDNGEYPFGPPNPGRDLEPQVEEPNLESFPLDVDWKTLPSDLMYKILGLPNRIDHAKSSLKLFVEYQAERPYDNCMEERQYLYAKLGLEVFSLAKKLRAEYGIDEREYITQRPDKLLTDEKDKIDSRRSKKTGSDMTELLG